jgi:hypothetical protein
MLGLVAPSRPDTSTRGSWYALGFVVSVQANWTRVVEDTVDPLGYFR